MAQWDSAQHATKYIMDLLIFGVSWGVTGRKHLTPSCILLLDHNIKTKIFLKTSEDALSRNHDVITPDNPHTLLWVFYCTMQFVQQNRGRAISIQSLITGAWHPEIREEIWDQIASDTHWQSATCSGKHTGVCPVVIYPIRYNTTILPSHSLYSAAGVIALALYALSVYIFITSCSMTGNKRHFLPLYSCMGSGGSSSASMTGFDTTAQAVSDEIHNTYKTQYLSVSHKVSAVQAVWIDTHCSAKCGWDYLCIVGACDSTRVDLL